MTDDVPWLLGSMLPKEPAADEVSLPSRKYPLKRAELLRSEADNKLLFNVTVSTAQGKVQAPGVVLAGESELFAERLTKQAGASSVVSLEGIELPTLRTAVEALFTGKLQVTKESVEALLGCAQQLQLPAVQAACCKSLASGLPYQQLSQALATAEKYGCSSVFLQHSLPLLAANLWQISPILLRSMARDSLISLLKRDDVNVPHENILAQVVLDWHCHHGPATPDLAELLDALRLRELAPWELKTLVQHLHQSFANFSRVSRSCLRHMECLDSPVTCTRVGGRRAWWVSEDFWGGSATWQFELMGCKWQVVALEENR